MIDPIRVFTRQFTQVEGGYLYYPSRKAGGKLVTQSEYEGLVANWQNVAGRRGQWKTIAVIIAAIAIWSIASQSLALPDWTNWFASAFGAVYVALRLLPASLAPRRLVSGRPDTTPPRPLRSAKREARALIEWRIVVFVLLVSGCVLFATSKSPDHTLSWWAWLIGSGTMFSLYAWLAFQKFRDRQS